MELSSKQKKKTNWRKKKSICLKFEHIGDLSIRKKPNKWTKTQKECHDKGLLHTCSSVIFRKGEPPPMAAYPSLLLGARTTEINFARGHWRNRNSLGSRMMSCIKMQMLKKRHSNNKGDDGRTETQRIDIQDQQINWTKMVEHHEVSLALQDSEEAPQPYLLRHVNEADILQHFLHVCLLP